MNFGPEIKTDQRIADGLNLKVNKQVPDAKEYTIKTNGKVGISLVEMIKMIVRL